MQRVSGAVGMSTAMNTSGIFSDVPTTHWAYGYIRTAHLLGIVNGYPDGTFRPDDYMTRAEVTTVAVKTFGRTLGAGVIIAGGTYLVASMLKKRKK